MRWILKKFWFPILLIVLKLLSKKYPWAGKAHSVISGGKAVLRQPKK
jgi:hypothetical protein